MLVMVVLVVVVVLVVDRVVVMTVISAQSSFWIESECRARNSIDFFRFLHNQSK